MGLFKKIFSALKKTKDSISSKLASLFKRSEINDEFYEELEEILISSDISLNTVEAIVNDLKDAVKEKKLKEKEAVEKELKDIIEGIFEQTQAQPISTPAVIMMTGVNGVGKTTTVGKLAAYFSSKGLSVTVAVADTFRAAAADQLTG